MAGNTGNSIALAKKYVDMLDEVYALTSLTIDLDSDADMARAGANANEIVIPKLALDGLADYNRNSGYVSGDADLTWETVRFNFDRGRMFSVDDMDDEETQNVAFGKVAGEFERTKVVPELDAFRFATYAGTTGISKVSTGATLSTGAAAMDAITVAVSKMDDDEVPEEGRILYITSTVLNMIKAMDTTKSRELLEGFAKVVKVPQARFYTAIKQNDGTTSGEEAGGYAKATGGKDINFMIIHPSAVMQYNKHVVPKIISPELNQDADAWKYGYRNYSLCDVYDNKVAGIYLHHKA